MKGTAISTSWVVDIQQAYDKLDTKTKAEYAKFGITFNKGLVLMLILPICYANLRSSDVTNVSITCVGMFLIREISCL